MKVEYTQTLEDADALLRSLVKHPPRGRNLSAHLGGAWLVVPGAVVAAWLALKLLMPQPFAMSFAEWLLLALVSACLVLHFFGNMFVRSLALRRIRRNRRFFERRVFAISADAITITAESAASTVLWRVVERIVEDDAHVFFYLSESEAILLPKRAFADGREFEEFMDRALRYQAEARAVAAEGQA